MSAGAGTMLSHLLLFAAVTAACQSLSAQADSPDSGCGHGEIVRYNVTFVGEWSPRKFPKMYPRYRPPAQWSKLVGRTHSNKYSMWEAGSFASPAMKMFAEEGDTAVFDRESQGHNGIFDAFTAAPITLGVGKSSAKIFLDGIHSKISLVVKLIPSPDWFVGVENLDLCENGQWKDDVRIRLDPYDAGTDKGLTFTSPNWPTIPQEEIHQITAHRPNHVASSFYYPKLKKLRRLGFLVFKKLLSYKREDKLHSQVPKNAVTTQIYENQESEEVQQLPPGDEIILSDAPSKTENEDKETEDKLDDDFEEQHLETSKDNEATPLDCLVSDFGAWTPCSKTCGFGQRERSRLIIQKPQNGGSSCPSLIQTSLCGSMKNCKWKHFRFQKWRTG